MLVHTIVGVIDSIACGSIDILVTRLTPRDTQFQIVQPRIGSCHELLLADTPTGGNRGEESKAVVFTETARTIITHRQRYKVAVVVTIVRLSKERDQRETAAASISLGYTRSCGWPHIGGIEHDEVLFISREPLIYLSVKLRSQQEVSTVFTHLQIIGNNGVPHPFCPMLLFCFYSILIVGYYAFGNRISKESLSLLRIVDTSRSTNIQTFDRVDIDEHVSEQTPIGVSVVFTALQDRERVLTLWETAGRRSLRQIAVGRIDRQQGVILEYTLNIAAGSTYLRRTVEREVLTDSHDILQHLIVAVDACRETVKVSRLDDTVVLVVS